MDDLFKDVDKNILGLKTDAYIDRILKLMQIMYYGKQLGENELTQKIVTNYNAVISLLGDNIQEAVKEYQDKHGEI